MRSSEQKKLDPKGLVIFAFISSLLLVTNIIGFNKYIYTGFDSVFNPFIIATRRVGRSTDILIKETLYKGSILRENIDLKRELVKYEELKAKNKEYLDQIARLQSQTNINAPRSKELRLVEITGVQNLFSSKPELLLHVGSDSNVKKGDIVYYESNTLFGFVKEVNGQTAKVMPYYSSDIQFNIPVQSFVDPSKKGFINKFSGGDVTIGNVSKDAGVSIGDIWVTTNDVLEVPANLVVGKVSSTIKDPQESFQQLKIDVPFNLRETGYVFVED